MNHSKKLLSALLALLLALSTFAAAALAADTADPAQSQLENDWYGWKHPNEVDASPAYNKAFRQFYATDPEIEIVNHIVYLKTTTRVRDGKKWVEQPGYVIVDYFDTDAAEAAATKLVIPKTVNDLPVVGIQMLRETTFSGGAWDGGYSNSTVQKLALKAGWETVPAFAFSNFTALEKVSLPQSLKTIGVSAFQGCAALKNIVGGGAITTVKSSAFADCAALCAFSKMEQIRVIEGSAFSDCAFKRLYLSGNAFLSGGDEDHYSAYGAFANNKNLREVRFAPAQKELVTTIGKGTFDGCTVLASVWLPRGGAVVIDDYAFKNCTAFLGFYHSEAVSEINRFAFEGCTRMGAFTVREDVRAIREDAFKGCSNLKRIDIRSTNTALFDGTHQGDTVYAGDPAEGVTNNFLKYVPETCIVLVKTAAMKQAVKATGFKGTVKVSVTVGAPKKLAAKQKGNGVFLKWSAVKNATGYRIYLYDAKAQTYTPVKTVKGQNSVTLYPKKNGKYTYAIRTFCDIAGDRSWMLTYKTFPTVAYKK